MIDLELPVRVRLVSSFEESMSPFIPQRRRHFTEAARAAALVARKAKMEEPDSFGLPELFVVKAGVQIFTWELRRFGGVVLERGLEGFASAALARADGDKALARMRTAPDLAKFKRQNQPRTNSMT